MAKDRNILTGQYVRIEQTPAKSSLRFFALIIDLMVMAAYIFLANFIDDYLQLNLSPAFIIIFVILPVLVYQPVCEALSGGQTLGKYLLKTRVVRCDGSSASVGDILLRWLLLPIDILLFGSVAAFSMLVTPRRQRVGDLAAGTMVIRLNSYDQMRVSLDEFRFVEDDYQPTYEQARQLSEEQTARIAHTLADRSTSRRHRIERLAIEMRGSLMLPADGLSHERFLSTLLSDYRYYSLQAV